MDPTFTRTQNVFWILLYLSTRSQFVTLCQRFEVLQSKLRYPWWHHHGHFLSTCLNPSLSRRRHYVRGWKHKNRAKQDRWDVYYVFLRVITLFPWQHLVVWLIPGSIIKVPVKWKHCFTAPVNRMSLRYDSASRGQKKHHEYPRCRFVKPF